MQRVCSESWGTLGLYRTQPTEHIIYNQDKKRWTKHENLSATYNKHPTWTKINLNQKQSKPTFYRKPIGMCLAGFGWGGVWKPITVTQPITLLVGYGLKTSQTT